MTRNAVIFNNESRLWCKPENKSVIKLIRILSLAAIVITMITSGQLSTYAQATGDSYEGWSDSCRDAGFNDGQNGSFTYATYDHCGDEANGDKAYYDGFIDGCMSVEGNTRDLCESATDG